MSQTFTNWKNDPVHFTVACASKLNMCVALHSVNDPRSIYDYEAFLLYFFALADLGLRPRARTTHPPPRTPAPPLPFLWCFLLYLKNSRSRPPLSEFLDPLLILFGLLSVSVSSGNYERMESWKCIATMDYKRPGCRLMVTTQRTKQEI